MTSTAQSATSATLEITRGAVLRGWHNPNIKHATVDVPRAESIAVEVADLIQAERDLNSIIWAHRDFCRGLLLDIQRLLGDPAIAIASVADDDLARLPGLVRDLWQQGAERGPHQWGVLEIMGHRTHRGRMTEAQQYGIAGVVVEELNPEGGFDRHFYPGAAIFSFHVRTEEFVRTWHQRYNTPSPVLTIAEDFDPQPEIDDDDGTGTETGTETDDTEVLAGVARDIGEAAQSA